MKYLLLGRAILQLGGWRGSLKKKLLLSVVCVAVIIGMIVSFRAVEDPPEEEFLEGERQEDGTYRRFHVAKVALLYYMSKCI